MFFDNPINAQDNAPIGVMETIVKDVLKEDLRTTFENQSSIEFKEKVITRAESLANAKFADDSLLSIGPDSSITIDKFVYDPDKSITDGAINLGKGFMRYASAKKGNNKLRLGSNAVTLTLRGTAVDIVNDRDITGIGVLDGTIEADTGDRRLILPEGTFLMVGSSNPEGEILTEAPDVLISARDEANSAARAGGTALILSDYEYPELPEGSKIIFDTEIGDITFCLAETIDQPIVSPIKNNMTGRSPFRVVSAAKQPESNFAVVLAPFNNKRPVDVASAKMGAPFYYGSLGLLSAPDGKRSQFIISLNRYKSIDSQYPIIGRAVNGLELLYELKMGSKIASDLGTIVVKSDGSCKDTN